MACMWIIVLCLCVELLRKQIIFRRVKIVLKEVFAFARCVCDILHVVCVFCGFVCRVLRNGAIVSKTVRKPFQKTTCVIILLFSVII